MIILILNDGFEEVEALTPLDILRREGYDIRSVGLIGKVVVGTHKIPVSCDMTADEVKADAVTAVILPGGMPGTTGLDGSAFVTDILRTVYEKGGRLAAICAAPSVLGHRGYLQGKEAVCFPGFEKHLTGAVLSERPVVTDGRITTAKDVYHAMDFSKELARVLKEDERAGADK